MSHKSHAYFRFFQRLGIDLDKDMEEAIGHMIGTGRAEFLEAELVDREWKWKEKWRISIKGAHPVIVWDSSKHKIITVMVDSF